MWFGLGEKTLDRCVCGHLDRDESIHLDDIGEMEGNTRCSVPFAFLAMCAYCRFCSPLPIEKLILSRCDGVFTDYQVARYLTVLATLCRLRSFKYGITGRTVFSVL